jgi:hypothetical protein
MWHRPRDALSEAVASALATRPLSGWPPNPETWLITVVCRKLIDGALLLARLVAGLLPGRFFGWPAPSVQSFEMDRVQYHPPVSRSVRYFTIRR